MLFRRFIFLTTLIAAMAVVFINIVQATSTPYRDFAVSDRLKQWEIHVQKQICHRNDKICKNKHSMLDQN